MPLYLSRTNVIPYVSYRSNHRNKRTAGTIVGSLVILGLLAGILTVFVAGTYLAYLMFKWFFIGIYRLAVGLYALIKKNHTTF